ncbi:MAG: MFS transporter [Promethearchaeota archaeon]
MNEKENKQETGKLSTKLKIAVLMALLTAIFCGLAYNVYAIIQSIIFDSEPSWELNAANAGDLLASMVILFAASGLIAGYYVDKIYKKAVAIIGGTICGISSILAGLALNWNLFFLAQVLISFGNGIISPVIFSIISDITPPEKRSTNYGLFIFFGFFGGLMGGIIFFGFLIFNDWRTPYLITGFIIISLSLSLLFVRLPKRGAKEHALEDVLKEEQAEYDYVINFSDLKDIFKRKSNIILILNFADAMPGGVFLLAVLWLADEHNLHNIALAGSILILILLVRFISPPIWGKVADSIYIKTKDDLVKIKICIILIIAYTPIFIAAILTPWWAPDNATAADLFATEGFILFLILFLIAYFISSGTQPIWQSAISEINLPEHRATSYMLANFVDQIGMAIGAFIAGRLIVAFESNGYTIAFIFAAIAGLINMVTWMIALRYYKDDKREIERILSERAEEIKKKANLNSK